MTGAFSKILIQSWYVVAATVLMTVTPLLVQFTRNAEGGYDYLAVSTTLLVEFIKLMLSLGFYLTTVPAHSRSHRKILMRDVLQFAVPAFVYFVLNNLIFVILAYINAVTYQILSAFKTVATAVLFRAFLKRRLHETQVIAILLLTCGIASSQTSDECPDVASLMSNLTAVGHSSRDPSLEWIGVSLALLACFLSAFGGVYSEKLLKKDGSVHSIHLQNMLLYIWGVFFNGIALLKDSERIATLGLLHGYSPRVWVMLVSTAFNGLAISAVLKFADNIVRVFAHAAAMMVTLVLETLFWGHEATVQVLLSICVVSLSTILYSRSPKHAALQVRPQSEMSESRCPILPTEAQPSVDKDVSGSGASGAKPIEEGLDTPTKESR